MIFNVFIPIGTLYSDHPSILDNPKFFNLKDRSMVTITPEQIEELKIETKENEALEVRQFFIPYLGKLSETDIQIKNIIDINTKAVKQLSKKYNGDVVNQFAIADMYETTSNKDEVSTFLLGYSVNFKMVNFPMKSIKNFLFDCFQMYSGAGNIINLYDEAIIKPLNKLFQKKRVMIHTPLSLYYKYNEYDEKKAKEESESK